MMYNMNNWRGRVENNLFNLTLSELLSVTRFCGAKDSIDKVFALLAIAWDVDLSSFRIDDGMSWTDLSVRLTQHTASQSNALDILRLIGLPRPNPQGDSFPSWVPNLSSSALLAPIFRYDWPNRAKSSIKDSPNINPMCDETSLVTKCLKLFDVLTIALTRMGAEEGYLEMLAVLQQWYQIAREHSSYASDRRNMINSVFATWMMNLGWQGVEEHIGKVFSAGLGWKWHVKLLGENVGSYNPEDLDELEIDLSDVNLFSPSNPHLYTPWAREVVFAKVDHSRGCSFGFTSGQQMTIFPPSAQENDHVCILCGLQLPFILQQDVDKSRHIIGCLLCSPAF